MSFNNLNTAISTYTPLFLNNFTAFFSIENSKTILALLSKTYLESKVCQEEYNLAKCLFEDSRYTTELVEVKVEDIDKWPNWCSSHNIKDLTKVTNTNLERIVSSLDQDRNFNHCMYYVDYCTICYC